MVRERTVSRPAYCSVKGTHRGPTVHTSARARLTPLDRSSRHRSVAAGIPREIRYGQIEKVTIPGAVDRLETILRLITTGPATGRQPSSAATPAAPEPFARRSRCETTPRDEAVEHRRRVHRRPPLKTAGQRPGQRSRLREPRDEDRAESKRDRTHAPLPDSQLPGPIDPAPRQPSGHHPRGMNNQAEAWRTRARASGSSSVRVR